MIKAPRGTYDLISGNAYVWKFLEEKAVVLFEKYGYEKIETPIFEATELFVRGIGETTEIVQKEMYNFTDKKGRKLTLRPEGTAPIVRAYLEHNLGKKEKLVKVYYSGPMFRYERPQAGRSRQFWQLGVEAIGSGDPALDVEQIYLCRHYLETIGVKKFIILLNSMGCRNCRPFYISKLKVYLEGCIDNLCDDCQKRVDLNPLRVFDCKNETCKNVIEEAPAIADYLCEDCKNHFEEVKKYLLKFGVDYKFEPTLVRGFDYYTKTTFEIQTPYLGAQNAIGGGGRYDNLVEDYGGEPTPAVGFALGVERLVMSLKKEDTLPKKPSVLNVFVAIQNESVRDYGLKVLKEVREAGIAADTDYTRRSLKAQMRLANKRKANCVLIVGEEEAKEKKVMVKNLAEGTQFKVDLGNVINWLRENLKKNGREKN